ncbi:hypothetical protein GCM10023210_39480 [Chryseobacterium ginsengisoli]|uniref:Uncharacterized protein n=1 Tax=Chryseobacterium ginsengisoli TaxID=363853 RepID=A0ABP9MYG8_9FLAO
MKINYSILFSLFLIFGANIFLFSQSSSKLYLSSAGTGFVYDITGSTPSTVSAALPAGITTPSYYNANNAGAVSNLAVGYDDTQASRPLVFLNSNTAASSPILKNGVATGLTLPIQIGGLGTNNVIGSYFGQAFGFSGKNLYRLYPTVSATPMAITGDAIWNAATSTVFASDTFYDYQNNVYTLLQNVVGTTYTRYLYRIAITSATTATATQVATISGPVGVRNTDADTSTNTNTGNVRGTAYLNGYVFASSGNGNDGVTLYRINIATGVSEYLAQYTATGLSASNIDLASVDYFQPFTFTCGSIALQGTSPYVAGTSSTRTLRIPISNIYAPGTYTINVTGTDFTNPAYSATITSTSTFIDVPLVYNGTGQGGYRTLTVDLNGSTTTCTYQAFIDADSDGDGILNSVDLDDDNDGILDSAEGCTATVTMALVSGATATSLTNTNTAIVPLVPPGTTLPGGGVTLTKTAGTGNTWSTFTPGVTTATMTVNGSQTSSFSTTYLDLTGTIPRTLNINFGVTANSISSNNNQYQYVIGIAGLGGEGNSVTNTFSVPLTVASNANVFNTNLYSLLNGTVSTTPGASGTVFTTNTPLGTAQGYTFFLVPADVASLTMTWTGNNDPHGIIFGVYNANCTADADGDGIPNRLDLDSDNDGCLDAMEGDENVAYSMLVNAQAGLSVGTGSSASNQNLCATASCVNANGVPNQVNAGGAADIAGTQGQGIGDSQNALISSCYCYKPVVTTGGTVLNTLQGVTSLGRAGASSANWPMVRKGAWTALESKTKGFVINRLTTAQIAAIPAANLVEGMMVYNTTLDCLQVNTTGTAGGWACFNIQTCPTN